MTNDTSAVVVREAGPPDASRIASLHVRSKRSAYRPFMPAWYVDSLDQDGHRIDYWQPMLGDRTDDRGGRKVWLATVAGIPAAFASIEPDRGAEATPTEVVPPGHAWLLHLHAAPEFRGRGIGPQLLAAFAAEARQQGYADAALWVYAQNEPARRFYEREGWKHDGSVEPRTLEAAGGSFETNMARYVRTL